MKKLILTFSAVATFFSGAIAQAPPDFNFEAWSNVPLSSTIQDPDGWASLNTLVLLGSPQSVFKETAAPYAGAISCKVTTVKVSGAAIPNPFRPGQNFDTAGIVGVGKISITPSASINFGYTLIPSSRPATLSFACKYTPMAGDSAFVSAYLTRWNGASRDTIATGEYATGTATASYAVNSLTMNYDPAFSTVWADTMLVFASSSIYRHGGAKIGSTFYIDAMSWSGYNSINEIGFKGDVSIYPNPAGSVVNFKSSVSAQQVFISDIAGRMIGKYPMNADMATVETSGFAPGMYLYNVLNENGEVINRGKFEVAR